MKAKFALICLALTGCTSWQAGLAVDPLDDNQLYGIIRLEQNIDPKASLYYEHISDPTTGSDGRGQNLFGINLLIK